jgi:mannose-6-phosphate isomerase
VLVSLSNVPRDYAWGSRSLLASLEGRDRADGPEAEVWFGDHPSDPSDLADGAGGTLDAWLAEAGEGRLPYLLKLLAAGSPLSIQVHPTLAQAREGHEREGGAGAARNYVDDNHKPEIIVALSERFEALCGLRDLEATRRLLGVIGEAASPLAERLTDAEALRAAIGWLLSGDRESAGTVQAIVAALAEARSTEFAGELANARRIAAIYPGDPGVVVALLMNYVVLRRGEGLFLGAGRLHAYVAGLGVELMAASDNVLRGGLTSKRIDVPELLAVLDPTPGPVPVVLPVTANNGSRGMESFPVPVDDFRLLRARVREGAAASLRPSGQAIVLATSGTVSVDDGERTVELRPGQAVFSSGAPEGGAWTLRFSGDGEVFVAEPGGER